MCTVYVKSEHFLSIGHTMPYYKNTSTFHLSISPPPKLYQVFSQLQQCFFFYKTNRKRKSFAATATIVVKLIVQILKVLKNVFANQRNKSCIWAVFSYGYIWYVHLQPVYTIPSIVLLPNIPKLKRREAHFLFLLFLQRLDWHSHKHKMRKKRTNWEYILVGQMVLWANEYWQQQF